MYKDTVTLFSQYNDVWYGTVIKGSDLNIDRAKILKTYGENSTDKALLHIKIIDGKVAGKTLVKPKNFDGTNFTVKTGNDFSFFIEGEWATLQANDDDYVSASCDGFYDYMKGEGALACKMVAEYSVIPHLEIIGG